MKSPHSSLKSCKNLANVVQKAWAPLPQTIWHGWGISNKFYTVKIHIFKVTLKMTTDHKEKKHILVLSGPWVLAMDDVINSDSPFIHSSASQDDRAERNRKHHKGLWQQCMLVPDQLCANVGRGGKFDRNALFVCNHSETPEFWLFTITLLQYKGRHQQKKNGFFRALPELPTPPPLTPIWASWSSFFGRQKRRFARMTGKKIEADNEGCNDNYDDNYGNFDDNYDKND